MTRTRPPLQGPHALLYARFLPAPVTADLKETQNLFLADVWWTSLLDCGTGPKKVRRWGGYFGIYFLSFIEGQLTNKICEVFKVCNVVTMCGHTVCSRHRVD